MACTSININSEDIKHSNNLPNKYLTLRLAMLKANRQRAMRMPKAAKPQITPYTVLGMISILLTKTLESRGGLLPT